MKPLTPSQRNVAAYMLAGWTRREIGKHLGVSTRTAGIHCLAVCKLAETRPDVSLADILRGLGIDPATAKRPVVQNPGTRTGPAIRVNALVSEADVACAVELFAAGYHYSEIARQMRRTVKQVAYMLERSRKGQPTPRRAEKRMLESADEIVAAALASAKRRECSWL